MQFKNLTMSFGTQTIFEDVNLNIPDNVKIGVVGVNGAGKTTLFKLLMGLEFADTGKIITNYNFILKNPNDVLNCLERDDIIPLDKDINKLWQKNSEERIINSVKKIMRRHK